MIGEGHYIYFVQQACGGNIKIGCSNSPIRRLHELMEWSPSPLIILATAPGRLRDEFHIHWTFREHWSHREWFRPAPEILELIGEIRATSLLPERAKGNGSARYRDMPGRATRKPWGAKSRARQSEAQLSWRQQKRERLAHDARGPA